MPQLEEIYKRLEKNKKRKREIAKMISDELSHDSRYKELKEEMKALREEKKAIEQTVRAGAPDAPEMDELKAEIQTDMELLSDLALNMYMKDQSIEIKDEYDQSWFPQFKVSFKKGNG